jgi:hypothetical protein
MRRMLITCKIALADFMGDAEILKAMKTNDDDTVTACKRLTSRRRHPGTQGLSLGGPG